MNTFEGAARLATWLALALCGGAWAEQPELLKPQPVAVVRASGLYDTVAEHLCSDGEYLSCLEMSEAQCHRDLQSTALRGCARQRYIMSSPAPDTPALLIAPGMIECIYRAHVTLRSLDVGRVNTCMADAKLEGPRVRTDQPDP